MCIQTVQMCISLLRASGWPWLLPTIPSFCTAGK